jgi:hypothetical protein
VTALRELIVGFYQHLQSVFLQRQILRTNADGKLATIGGEFYPLPSQNSLLQEEVFTVEFFWTEWWIDFAYFWEDGAKPLVAVVPY